MGGKSSLYLESLKVRIASARFDPSLEEQSRSVILAELVTEYDNLTEILQRLASIEARLPRQ